MGNFTLLQRRSTGYYFRQGIPHELWAIAGKREFVKSLGTNNRTEALARHKELTLQFSRYLEQLRQGMQHAALPSMNQIPMSNPAPATESAPHTESNATTSGKGKTLEWLAEEWIRQKAPHEKHFKKAGLALRIAKMFQELHGKTLTLMAPRTLPVFIIGNYLAQPKDGSGYWIAPA